MHETIGSAVPITTFKKTLPIIGFLLLSGITLGLWRTQEDHRNQLLLHHMENLAEQFRIRIEGMMNARIASLETITARWVERQPPDFSRERFSGFARATIEHYPGIAGIYWINPEGVIQWVFPESDHGPAVGNNVHHHLDARCRDVFSSAGLAAAPLLTPCVLLYQGGVGFYVVMALRYEGNLQGYLAGVFRAKQVMELSFSAAMLEDYLVRIDEGEEPIYWNKTRKPIDSPSKTLHVIRDIQFAGKSWQLRLEPRAGQSLSELAGDLTFLTFGFGLSAMLALTLHFLLQRMAMYRATCDQALREVHDRKKAEEALRENEKKLQHLLSELAEKNAELESFAYAVSHDLKTPIVTIEGFIGALKEDFGDALPESADKYLAYMSDAARRMELLINDLLELSRIGRLKEEKTEFSLADPTHEALASLEPHIEARGVVVHVQEGLPVVRGERNRVGQVMDNLLSNAVKYIGKDNPFPRIEVGCEERDGEMVFFVRDNGIGIEEKYFDRLFQSFERLPAAMRAGEGTGMGLAIVKRIIESHGGRIWLHSKPGRETTFYFTLAKKDTETHET
jgi:signal transduction histidine kinase